MSSERGTCRRRLGPFIPTPALGVALAVMLLAACSGDGGGCGCSGFKQQEFPEQHYDKTVPRSGQVRVTEAGLAFLEQNLDTILGEALPDGLSFCFSETENSGARICHTRTCDSGQTGCQMQLSIDKAVFRTDPPNKRLLLDITVGSLNEVIPFDYDAGIGTVECNADLHENGQDQDVPGTIDATVPIEFSVDRQSPTNEVKIDVAEIEPDMSDLGIDIDARSSGIGHEAACEGAADSIVKPIARGQLEDELKNTLNEQVQQGLRERLCRACGEGEPECPTDSSCVNSHEDVDVCQWDQRDSCVRRPLGVEGRLVLDQVVGEFMEPESANIDLMAKLADTAEVTDGGLNLGLRAGFQQDQLRDCTPASPDTRPSLMPIDASPKIFTNTQPDTSNPPETFMVGIGLHKNAVEQMLWTTWASGGTCFKVGTEFNDMLKTDSLSLFLPSLKKLTKRSAPVFLKVTPQTAPTVELGENTIRETDSGYELDDPLMTINWSDLDLHFYAFTQDRFTRLYTTRIDIELPVGLTPNDMGQLVPVLGDLEEAFTNIRVRNHGILAEDKEKLREVVPNLLQVALPQLTGSLNEPIDLPTVAGMRLALEQDDITTVDNNQFIALYGNLEEAPTMDGQMLVTDARPEILETAVDLSRRTGDGLRRPRVTVELATKRADRVSLNDDAYEYSYRIDNGFWSMYTKRDRLVLDDPVFSLPGEHTIQVRARAAGSPGTATAPVETTVAIDYQAPELELDRDDDQLVFEARDLVDASDELQYRYRVETTAGDRLMNWSGWSSSSTVDLSTIGVDGRFRLIAQARDTSGYVGEASDIFERRPEIVSVETFDESGESDGEPAAPQTGACGVAADQRRGPAGGWLWAALALVGLGLLRRRRDGTDAVASVGDRPRSPETGGETTAPGRRWRLLLTAFAVATALLATGCSNDLSEGDNRCNNDCAAWESCNGDTCEPEECDGPDACPDGAVCIDGTCEQAQCESDDDCSCASDQKATCMDGQCMCRDFCSDGCGDEQYCCHHDDTCRSYPTPCEGKTCDRGYKPERTDKGEPDRKECSVSGAECECTEMEPLDLRWYGDDADADSNGGSTAVTAYNRYYGDLMVGTVDDNLEPTWYFPDGVPPDGEIVAAPSGPREGTDEKGDDVGSHTTVAVDGNDNLHVFYRSEETDALKYARGSSGSEGYTFETTEVDAETDTGYYTTATVRDGVVHAFYGVPDVDVEIDGETYDGSQLRHVSFPVDTGLSELAPDPEAVVSAGPPNPCNGCPDGEQCVASSGQCVAETDDCEGGCDDGDACLESECRTVYSTPSTPAHRLMTGLYPRAVPAGDDLAVAFYDHLDRRIGWVRGTTGEWSEPTYLESPTGPYADLAVDGDGNLHLAYMDPDDNVLRYRPPGGGGAEVVADGTRNRSSEYLVASIGEDVDLWLDGGAPHATFQDATTHALLQADRSGTDNWSVTPLSTSGPLDQYEGARGFYAANTGPAGDVVVEHVIDQQIEPAEARLEFKRLE